MTDNTTPSNGRQDVEAPKANKKPPSKRQQRQAESAVQIYNTLPTAADVVFMARELILCTLPHSDPGKVLAWSRTNGNLTLAIKTGINGKTGESYGIPYGIIPRLIMVWMVTEIIRTKSRRLELGNGLSDFLASLGLNAANGTGKRSDARRAREQMERLFRSTISFEYSLKGVGRSGSAWMDMPVAPKMVLWWSEKDPEQTALFGSHIEVGEDFYKAVLSAPSPLDIRVLRYVKDSSLGIDLYTILNREAFRAMKEEKPRFLAWEWLHEQTGNEYGTLHDFRKKALEQIEAILRVHPGLIVTQQKGHRGQKSGLWISNLSTPSIPPDPRREPIQGDPNQTPPTLVLVPPPPPPPERLLKPATVERFRALYPRLDPYACKADFDEWQEGLPPEDRARHYDRAFMGFARKWIVGKLIVSNP